LRGIRGRKARNQGNLRCGGDPRRAACPILPAGCGAPRRRKSPSYNARLLSKRCPGAPPTRDSPPIFSFLRTP